MKLRKINELISIAIRILAIKGDQKQLNAIKCNQRQSKAIKGDQGRSKTIKGDQRGSNRSEVIKQSWIIKEDQIQPKSIKDDQSKATKSSHYRPFKSAKIFECCYEILKIHKDALEFALSHLYLALKRLLSITHQKSFKSNKRSRSYPFACAKTNSKVTGGAINLLIDTGNYGKFIKNSFKIVTSQSLTLSKFGISLRLEL